MLLAGSDHLNERCLDKNNTPDVLKKEQKKLERMILESFEKGDTNLGNNEDILTQSIKVDKLIVKRMQKINITKNNGVKDK
jgi:hypothetical protein